MTGNAKTALFLLQRGADPKTVDLKGNSLLHGCADGGHLELAQAMVSMGVDPRLRNKEGKRALDIARERGYPELVKYLQKFQ
jgi:ankyrin repeat protein